MGSDPRKREEAMSSTGVASENVVPRVGTVARRNDGLVLTARWQLLLKYLVELLRMSPLHSRSTNNDSLVVRCFTSSLFPSYD